MGTDRSKLRGNVDEDTLDRWRAFADEYGLDMSWLLEAMGRKLPQPGERLPTWFREVVAEARRVRAQRRNRRVKD